MKFEALQKEAFHAQQAIFSFGSENKLLGMNIMLCLVGGNGKK